MNRIVRSRNVVPTRRTGRTMNETDPPPKGSLIPTVTEVRGSGSGPDSRSVRFQLLSPSRLPPFSMGRVTLCFKHTKPHSQGNKRGSFTRNFLFSHPHMGTIPATPSTDTWPDYLVECTRTITRVLQHDDYHSVQKSNAEHIHHLLMKRILPYGFSFTGPPFH